MLMSKYSLEQDCPSKSYRRLFSRFGFESIHVVLKKKGGGGGEESLSESQTSMHNVIQYNHCLK